MSVSGVSKIMHCGILNMPYCVIVSIFNQCVVWARFSSCQVMSNYCCSFFTVPPMIIHHVSSLSQELERKPSISLMSDHQNWLKCDNLLNCKETKMCEKNASSF